jgi:cytochrome c oxidase cbb3-type subunit 4
MDLHHLYSLLMTAWIVWFFVLFGGIVAWALWPGRKDKFESARFLPLRETE